MSTAFIDYTLLYSYITYGRDEMKFEFDDSVRHLSVELYGIYVRHLGLNNSAEIITLITGHVCLNRRFHVKTDM